MTYFAEIDQSRQVGGRIKAVNPGTAGHSLGLQPGDILLEINSQPVQDVIDVQFYSAETDLNLTVQRGDRSLTIEGQREFGQEFGLEFEHPTFDMDIRRCINLCEFCFVLQMAPRFRRTLYIKDDDYRYSFLMGHYVTLTNPDEHDWWRIENMRLSPLYISVHATELSVRRKFLRNPEAPDILEQLRWLAERRIEVHCQLVIVPGLNDGLILEQSIDDLSELWPAVRSITVVPVGLTRHHKYSMRPHTRAEAQEMIKYIDHLQKAFKVKLGANFVYLTDEWYLVAGSPIPPVDYYAGLDLTENGLGMVRAFLDEWSDLKMEIEERASLLEPVDQPDLKRHLILITGSLFAPVLEEAAVEFSQLTGAIVEVVPVINKRLGESITAAGLLMVEDIAGVLGSQHIGDLVVLPRVVFDHPDVISLDDRTPQELANLLKKPVALADNMGDVWDALRGTSKLVYYLVH